MPKAEKAAPPAKSAKAAKKPKGKTKLVFARMGAIRSIRWRRVALFTLLAIVFGPVLLVLPLRFVDPPTTMFMLDRTIDRWRADDRPWYPRRKTVDLDAISPSMVLAALASEDGAFYLHDGFDLKQIESAIDAKLDGKKLRGASTISQQTAKNLFLWDGRSFVRKGLEAYFTVYLELLLPKARILELYLNLVECGDGVFGVEAGAQHHFKKSAAKLDPNESARLASIFPSPRKWRPNGAGSDKRATRVRELMELGIPRPKESKD